MRLSSYPAPPGKQTRVSNCSNALLTNYYIQSSPEHSKRFIPNGTAVPTDIFIATTRGNCHQRKSKLLHVVRRQGVGLAYVFEEPDARAR